MNEQLPIDNPEAPFELQFEEGWKEVLAASDDSIYKLWMAELVAQTQNRMGQVDENAAWAADPEEVLRRWQVAIELVAGAAIDIEHLKKLTSVNIVKEALIAFKMNRSSMGWDEKGLAFSVRNLSTFNIDRIDLRDLPAPRSDND